MRDPRYPEFPGRTISQSDIDTYLKCGALYFFRREHTGRATVAATAGSAVAHAAHFDNMIKMESGGWKRLKASEMVDLAVSRFEELCSTFEVAGDRNDGLERAQGAAIAYHRDISPGVDPVAAEEKLSAKLSARFRLVGQPDAFEQLAVRDTKTGRRWSAVSVHESRQLTGYGFLFEEKYGRPPERYAIDTIFREGKEWRGETIWTKRLGDQRSRFLRTVNQVVKGIDAGLETPAPAGAWWCSKEWCPFWNQCLVRP